MKAIENLQRLAIKAKHLAGIPYSKADFDLIYLNDIIRSGCFDGAEAQGDNVSVTTRNGTHLLARLYPHSDCFTLKQIFIDQEYRPLVSIFDANGIDTRGLKILDAGANVGYTSSYFFERFSDAEIVCIEPDPENQAVLHRNLELFIREGRATPLRMGLMGEDGKYLSTERGFRDGKDHAITTTEVTEETQLQSISVAGVMKLKGWETIDILKMDIEGAERFVFGDEATAEFLVRVRTAAIEIHDEFGIRDRIYKILRSSGFVIIDAGETTFGLNLGFR